MKNFFKNFFKVQPEEVAIFLWAAALLFLIRGSNLLFNNFAETAFLKRFGVEYLPLVYMANAFATFILMGFMAGVMRKISSAKLLALTLFTCGSLVAVMRLPVYLHFDMVYPVLFLLKAQFEALFALLFWNLANDLFNTRQSKRIFPLIAAGGVLGAILGSFGTPQLAKLIRMDNLMLAYLCSTAAAATVGLRMNALFPTLPISERRAKKGKPKQSFLQEMKQVWPMMKESTLIKILVLLTFLPNVMIPIMNYQFNYAVNQTFGTEQGLIQFFGYFRGAQNIISLIILLFVGKLYSRWGLPVALMFHPFNYVIAFIGFLWRFDVVAAIYARITTVVLRVTINNPARDILMGLFPARYRPILRPFLRGTVVRIGTLLGSGFVLLAEGVMHPRYLSIFGITFGLMWVATSIWLKRSYSDILLGLVSQNVIDLRSLEERDLGQLFGDKRSQERLVQACLNSNGRACVLYAEMLKTQKVPEADKHLLSLIRERDEATASQLVRLISPDAGDEAIEVFEELVEEAKPKLTVAIAGAASRFSGDKSQAFLSKLLTESNIPAVRAQAIGGLYDMDPSGFDKTIRQWLQSADPIERRAGVLAAGGSNNTDYIKPLRELFEREQEPKVIGEILLALTRLQDPGAKQLVLARLHKDAGDVPVAVLERLPVEDKATARALISLLGDPNPELAELAQRKLRTASDLDLDLLIEGLATPYRQVREGLYQLMESLKISDQDIIGFARSYLQKAYSHLLEARDVEQTFPESNERDFLAQHLRDKQQARVDNILRVLATQDHSGQLRVVLRGLDSNDERLRSNAVEALEEVVGRSLSESMVPLLEKSDPAQRLAIGRRLFKLPASLGGKDELVRHLLAADDWLIQFYTLMLGSRGDGLRLGSDDWERLINSQNRQVRMLAGTLKTAGGKSEAVEEAVMQEANNLTDKIVLLRGMEIFKELKVNELAAIASLCEEQDFEPGQAIIAEGEVGDNMFLVVSGKVTVSKKADDGCSVDLADMGGGEYFGEMALFDDSPRSATVTSKEPTSCLVLHKREFREAVREYPQVALQMCTELSRRLRELHTKIQTMPVCLT
jgi:HEAT repeat protein